MSESEGKRCRSSNAIMEILIILFLILLNGFFSMSEIALVSARKARLKASANRGNRNARTALETAEQPNRFLSTVQIGITLIGILTGIFSGQKITQDLSAKLAGVEILEPYAHSLAVAIVVLVITYFSLVLGELIPKQIGMSHPESIATAVAGPMRWLTRISLPFVWLLTKSTEGIARLLRLHRVSSHTVSEEEIKAIIQEGTLGGEIQEIEQDIVERVFILGDQKVSALMTHRSDILTLHESDDAESIRKTILKEMHSIYPVMNARRDDLLGVVSLKSLFKSISEPGFSLKDHMEKPQFVVENISAYETLKLFKNSNIHYGIVVDEYGQMQGIITMDDLLKALVGDVSEFYEDEFTFLERDDKSYLVDGQYPFHEFLRKFELEELASEYEVDTISGLIYNVLKHVPVSGQKLRWLDFEIEIVDMDRARIDKVIIRRLD